MAAGDGQRGTYSRHPQRGNSTQLVTADVTDLAPHVIGFVPSVDGIVALRARYDSLEGSSYIDHPVLAGRFYPLDVRDIDITNSTASQAVLVYRQL